MLEGIIDDVKDRADIGIMSVPIDEGGLPAPEIDVPEIDGDSEYDRPSFVNEEMLMGADNKPDAGPDGPYI